MLVVETEVLRIGEGAVLTATPTRTSEELFTTPELTERSVRQEDVNMLWKAPNGLGELTPVSKHDNTTGTAVSRQRSLFPGQSPSSSL